ncbi:hypothetical protein [Microbacterium sp. ZOR0019]|uniref:hypothetical protein n=1 Tax=Microbacterium sp. ZOR0019 TaxID=1339233 RepID=UPI0012DFF992|nr:hypothetical protein [Microbacterium sp. ZOR0019]
MRDPADAVDFELILDRNSDAPAELHAVGEQYWENMGIDAETNEIRWARKTGEIDFKPWSGTAHYAAGAALTASSPTFSCSSCGGVLTLSSRQTLTDARRGLAVECRSCNTLVDERAATVLDPKTQAKREKRAQTERIQAAARAEQFARQEEQRARESELEASRRQVVEATYPSEDNDGGYAVDKASLRAKIAALAVIHAAGTPDGLIYPVQYDTSLAPSSETARDLFLAALHADLLLIHPSSPPQAFVWGDDDPLELTTSFYAHLARFHVPGEGSLARRLQSFTGYLREALQIDALWSTDRHDLIALSQELVAEEAVRYFRYYLGSLNLPDPAEHHLEALRTHVAKAAVNFSLGQLYRMAWSSSRDAISAYERIAGLSRDKASTHAVNKFAQWVQRALDAPDDLGGPFNEDTINLPLSAATDIVFRVVLGLNPMRATPLDVSDALTGSPDEELRRACDDRIPDRAELIEWLRTDQSWSAGGFRAALERVGGEFYAPCAPNCAHGRVPSVAYNAGRLFDRIAARVGESDGAIVVAEAMAIGNDTDYRGRAGDLALALVLAELGREPSRAD